MSQGLEEQIILLDSKKVTVRKAAAEYLFNNINEPEIIQHLNIGRWKMLLDGVKNCLLKDADKILDDEKKKGTDLTSKYISADLLLVVLRYGLKENHLDVGEITGYLINSLRNQKMRKYFEVSFLTAINDYVLMNDHNRSQLDINQHWEALFELIKSFYSKTNVTSDLKKHYVKSLMLLFKYAPSCGYPTQTYRDEIRFVMDLVENVRKTDHKCIQLDIVEIITDFCKYNAKDCRLSCCELGNYTFMHIFELYECNGRGEELKVKLLEYFLLQMTLHHPNGECGNMAVTYPNWKNNMIKIYSILIKEVNFYLNLNNKNTSLFIPLNKDIETILDTFETLFSELLYQLNGTNDINMSLSMSNVSQMPASKKARIDEINVQSIILDIKNNKEWPWINLLSFTLKKYPCLIDLNDIKNLLQILTTILVESQKINLKHQTYGFLIVLEEIERKISWENDNTNLKQWKEISKYALLSIANNNNAHILIKKLLLRQNIIDSEKLLENIMLLKDASSTILECLLVLLPQINFTRSDTKKQESILNWLFSQNCSYLSCKKSVYIVGGFMFKQWPNDIVLKDDESQSNYCDIVDTYYKINLDLKDNAEEVLLDKNPPQNRIVDHEAIYKLKIIIREKIVTKDIESILHVIEFLVNLIDFSVSYKLSDGLTEWLEEFLQDIFNKLEDFFTVIPNNTLLKNIVMYMTMLNNILMPKKNQNVDTLLRQLIPQNFLMVIFELQNLIEEEKSNGNTSPQLFTIKKSITKMLSLYCFILNEEILENQINVLDVLCKQSLDTDEDCKIVILILEHLKYTKPDCLPNAVAENILSNIGDLAGKKFTIYEYAIDILNIVKNFYSHLSHLNEENRTSSIKIISGFYSNKESYGPKVPYAILECIESIYKVDPNAIFSKTDGQELIALVPDFLSSEHIEVRLKAIETLVTFFEFTSKSKDISDVHRQEIILNSIYEVSEKEVQRTGSPDDITNTNATVLLIFAKLMLSCNFWIEECLLCLMKLMQISNLQSVDKLLVTVSQKLTNTKSQKTFLENNLPNLIEKWIDQGQKLNQFPYKLLNCTDEMNFHKKYIHICVPFLIKDDTQGLKRAASELGVDEKDLIIQAVPKIFTKLVHEEIENLSTENIARNISMLRLSNYLTQDEIMDILKNNLDEIVLNLLLFVTDSRKIMELFGETVMFYNKYMSYEQFLECLRFLKEFLNLYDDILSHLLLNQMNKIERILLKVKSNIYNTITLQDKIKHFHHYTIILNLLLQSINEKSVFSVYFIRDTSYYLINLIKSNLSCDVFRKVVAVYSLGYFKEILPKYSDIFQHFFIFIVNSLKNVIITNEKLKNDCLEIVKFIIVNNLTYLTDSISKLDTFPHTEEFEKFNKIIKNLKYNNKNVSLKQEIDFFLNSNDDECNSSQEDSLKHLRTVLVKQKVQLKNMYEGLKNIRGFSEDCVESHLHRLVAKLVKMTWGKDKNVSSEAVKCLGELGPANLQTLILQPGESLKNDKYTPFEMISGISVLLLSKYIVDPDIRIAKVASDALYHVLHSKEGRKMANSAFSFSKKGCVNEKCLVPYITAEKITKNSQVELNHALFIETVNNNELWCPKNIITHELWVIELVTTLLRGFKDVCFLQKLIPICEEKIEICEDLLPHLIFLSLHDKNVPKFLSAQINTFFENQWFFSLKRPSVKDIITDERTVKCMLNIVDFLRLQKSNPKHNKVHSLDVDYLYVSQAFQYCDNHFAALLYIEQYCFLKLETIQKQNHYKPLPSGYTKHDLIYDTMDTETAKAMHNIFRKAYKAIGDLDAMTGCGISFILEPEFRVESYKDSNQWDQVAHFYEMQVGRGDVSCRSHLMDSLKMCSLYEVPLLCANSLEEQQYECLWRLGQWNFEEPTTSSSSTNLNNINDVEKHKFLSLKSILEDEDKFNLEKTFNLQTLCLVEKLKHTNLECSKNLYPVLTEIQSFVEASDFSTFNSSDDLEELFHKWDLQDLITESSEFRYVEPIFAQRVVLLKNYLSRVENNSLKEIMVDMMLKFADLARNENEHRVASRILTDLQRMSNINDIQKAKIDLSQAQLYWSLNDKMAAKHILSKLGRNEAENPIIRSRALKLSGQYMVETYSENRQIIIADYFLKSLKIIENIDEDSKKQEYDNIMDTYDKLASFADREYQQIVLHMKSDIFLKKISNMEKSKETARSLKSKGEELTKDEKMAMLIHERQSVIDEKEIENNKKERDTFLKLALSYYLRNLQRSDKNNIRIFRVMSLFLENRSNNSIKDIITEYMKKVPSYKYIDMLPQLVPHISSEKSDLFSKEIYNIVKKCALEHPHHTLPLLLSLSNANEDRKHTKSKTNTFSNDDRVNGANKLLKTIKETLKSDLIDKMDMVAKALIELAYYEAKNTNARKNDFSIPASQKITKVKNFDQVLLPTVNLPVSKSNNYENIVGIAGFVQTFSNVGGINTPKRLKCRGTDGVERSQLVKGRDDLRQDSVMQQVFTIMNTLLANNKQTTDLRIRTYKIMPLSMRSGILEWVDNSMPLGNYLIGESNNGAHYRYRSNDEFTPRECRTKYMDAVRQSPDVRLKIFDQICKKTRPVFHKFFEEYFLQPTVWYERRRAYIHSIATTSMCGYILGIGDRHVSNILVDQNTAEVIHIDFGIAFEQGRCLPTPETVPFRLTRDIVDGMGISGVEGIFKRSCEKTMEVLRTNSQTILTILEVLLYDPLYCWSVTPAEANRRQTDELNEHSDIEENFEEAGNEQNFTAERALLRLRSKLQGTEEGNQVSIEHQVGTLIQQATDPANLCRLFYGWQPYL